jgi:hypothetical protein
MLWIELRQNTSRGWVELFCRSAVLVHDARQKPVVLKDFVDGRRIAAEQFVQFGLLHIVLPSVRRTRAGRLGRHQRVVRICKDPELLPAHAAGRGAPTVTGYEFWREPLLPLRRRTPQGAVHIRLPVSGQ